MDSKAFKQGKRYKLTQLFIKMSPSGVISLLKTNQHEKGIAHRNKLHPEKDNSTLT